MSDPTKPHIADREPVNWRAWALGIALLLLVIIVAQNAQEVHFDVLFVSTSAPLIVILVIAALLGAVIGYVAAVMRRHRREARRWEEDKQGG